MNRFRDITIARKYKWALLVESQVFAQMDQLTGNSLTERQTYAPIDRWMIGQNLGHTRLKMTETFVSNMLMTALDRRIVFFFGGFWKTKTKTTGGLKSQPSASEDSQIVPSLKGIKTRNSAFLGQSVKICIQGQFFVLNKTRRGTRLIF